jgi:hypothetical protein
LGENISYVEANHNQIYSIILYFSNNHFFPKCYQAQHLDTMNNTIVQEQDASSSSICWAGGNSPYCTSAFEAVFTFNPVLVPLFISKGAPRQTG